jgi:hypothetical protein
MIIFAEPLDYLVIEAGFVQGQRQNIRADVGDIVAKFPGGVAAATAYVAGLGAGIPASHCSVRMALQDAARAEFARQGLRV